MPSSQSNQRRIFQLRKAELRRILEDSAVERVIIPVSGQTQLAGLPPKSLTLTRVFRLAQMMPVWLRDWRADGLGVLRGVPPG